MTSVFTTNIGLEQPGLGDYPNTWNTPVNADWALLDQALGSTTSISGLTNANTTLTVAQSAYFLFVVSGTLTGNVKIIFPSTIGGRKVIRNNCTGAYTLTICNGAGDTGVVVAQSATSAVLLNASAAALDATGSFANLPQLAADTVVGNASGSPGAAAALSQAQLTALINPATTSLSGAVGPYPNNTTTFLRGDGTFAALTSTVTPQGRLTLTSGTPVLSSSSGTGISTIYYTPYLGQIGPVWNGSNFVPTVIPEISVSVSGLTPGSIYDAFYWSNSGTMTIVCGPAWSSSTSRSAGTALTRTQGILVNSVNLSGGPNAGYGVYVGTIAIDASGATVTFNPQPTSASGGPTNGAWIGLWNQYNRIPISAQAQDSKASWPYNTATFRAADASNNNRITVVTGQAEDSSIVTYSGAITSTVFATCFVGVGVNSITSPSGVIGGVNDTTGTNSITATYSIPPSLGLQYYQALEAGGGSGTQTWSGGQNMQISGQFRF